MLPPLMELAAKIPYWPTNEKIQKQIRDYLIQLMDLQSSPKYHQEGDTWTHTYLALKHAQDNNMSYTIQWAILLHDIGKIWTTDPNNNYSAYGHEYISYLIAKDKILPYFVSVQTQRHRPFPIEEIILLIKYHDLGFHLPATLKIGKSFRKAYKTVQKDSPYGGDSNYLTYFFDTLIQVIECDQMGRLPQGDIHLRIKPYIEHMLINI